MPRRRFSLRCTVGQDLANSRREEGRDELSVNVGATLTSADVVNSIRSSALRSIPAMVIFCLKFLRWCWELFVVKIEGERSFLSLPQKVNFSVFRSTRDDWLAQNIFEPASKGKSTPATLQHQNISSAKKVRDSLSIVTD